MRDTFERSRGAKWTVAAVALVSTVVLLVTAMAALNDKPSAAGGNTDPSRPDGMDSGQSTAVTEVEIPELNETPTSVTEGSDTADELPQRSRLTDVDGFIADEAPLSPFDTDPPAIANLTPDLRDAIRRAATDARASGVEMFISSGWRSDRYQQALLDEAIVTYGSEEEALKWVSTADASSHVTGEAVDIGPTEAASWLSQHGSDYGLCQTYANEMWHFELAVGPGGVCPEPISDASAG